MFALASLLVAGGFLCTGTMAYRKLRPDAGWLRRPARRGVTPIPVEAAEAVTDGTLQHANRTLLLSSVSLGVTTAGVFVKPFLMLVSVPVGLIIFAPTFRAAWRALRQDHRVTTPVVDAVRITVCVVMGYYFALAIDTWLRTVTHKLLVQTEDDLDQTVDKLFVDPARFGMGLYGWRRYRDRGDGIGNR